MDYKFNKLDNRNTVEQKRRIKGLREAYLERHYVQWVISEVTKDKAQHVRLQAQSDMKRSFSS